jgi:hypothetical protein
MNKEISITLTKDEWRSVETWVTSASHRTFEKTYKARLTELLEFITPLCRSLYFSDDMSAMNIPYDSEHTLTLDRSYFRYLVFSVGIIAYDLLFSFKSQTSQTALEIVKKIEEQGDEKWKKTRS